MLLAFQEEFDSNSLPPPLLTALDRSGTLLALSDAQRRFSHNNTIQFGATWGVSLGQRETADPTNQDRQTLLSSTQGGRTSWLMPEHTPPPPPYPPPPESPTVTLWLP